jgi:hypothetical protein
MTARFTRCRNKRSSSTTDRATVCLRYSLHILRCSPHAISLPSRLSSSASCCGPFPVVSLCPFFVAFPLAPSLGLRALAKPEPDDDCYCQCNCYYRVFYYEVIHVCLLSEFPPCMVVISKIQPTTSKNHLFLFLYFPLFLRLMS